MDMLKMKDDHYKVSYTYYSCEFLTCDVDMGRFVYVLSESDIIYHQ